MIKETVKIKCTDNHEHIVGDIGGKIADAGFLPCPTQGCLRNGFVVTSTENDMQHLDQVDVCETCGQPLAKAGFVDLKDRSQE